MKSVAKLMNEYFVPAHSVQLREAALPIEVEKNAWEYLKDPERMRRSYEFKDERSVRYFVEDILRYQEDAKHHAKILIEHKLVKVEVYTHGVDRVTNMDHEYSQACDEIYTDAIEGEQNDRPV